MSSARIQATLSINLHYQYYNNKMLLKNGSRLFNRQFRVFCCTQRNQLLNNCLIKENYLLKTKQKMTKLFIQRCYSNKTNQDKQEQKPVRLPPLAAEVASEYLSQENYEALEGLLSNKAIQDLRHKISKLSPEQKKLIPIDKRDIYGYFHIQFSYTIEVVYEGEGVYSPVLVIPRSSHSGQVFVEHLGTMLLQHKPSDNSKQTVSFEVRNMNIIYSQRRSNFHINNNGIVTIKKMLYRENESIHYVAILAIDNGVPALTATTTLTVTATDVNDNAPRLRENTAILKENSPPTNNTITLIAIDDDDKTKGNRPPLIIDHSTFSLTETTGMIKMKLEKPLFNYGLNFEVKDYQTSVTAHVTIDVKKISQEAIINSGSMRISVFLYDDFIKINNQGTICSQWQEITMHKSWNYITELDFSDSKIIDNYFDRKIPTESELEILLSRCGRYLRKLNLSSDYDDQILKAVNNYCPNLTSLKLNLTEHVQRKYDENCFINAFTKMTDLKQFFIHSAYGHGILESLDSLPANIMEIHLSMKSYSSKNSTYHSHFQNVNVTVVGLPDSYSTNVQLYFCTRQLNSELFKINNKPKFKYVVIEIIESYLLFRFNLNDKSIDEYKIWLSEIKVNDGQWHTVKVSRYGSACMIKLDGSEGIRSNETIIFKGQNFIIDKNECVYVASFKNVVSQCYDDDNKQCQV
ncbi:hypothetical protein HCN44_002194 [Aphidius gifuensis]|uniref:Uncharacterized protein n=1 Tax=Aphidius gifuensis TaxID=684658 RepID=A0A834Y0V1_APHGI|nr:hypothetical protein HCN44_002194 [Aphidius gifuensis]